MNGRSADGRGWATGMGALYMLYYQDNAVGGEQISVNHTGNIHTPEHLSMISLFQMWSIPLLWHLYVNFTKLMSLVICETFNMNRAGTPDHQVKLSTSSLSSA